MANTENTRSGSVIWVGGEYLPTDGDAEYPRNAVEVTTTNTTRPRRFIC